MMMKSYETYFRVEISLVNIDEGNEKQRKTKIKSEN